MTESSRVQTDRLLEMSKLSALTLNNEALFEVCLQCPTYDPNRSDWRATTARHLLGQSRELRRNDHGRAVDCFYDAAHCLRIATVLYRVVVPPLVGSAMAQRHVHEAQLAEAFIRLNERVAEHVTVALDLYTRYMRELMGLAGEGMMDLRLPPLIAEISCRLGDLRLAREMEHLLDARRTLDAYESALRIFEPDLFEAESVN